MIDLSNLSATSFRLVAWSDMLLIEVVTSATEAKKTERAISPVSSLRLASFCSVPVAPEIKFCQVSDTFIQCVNRSYNQDGSDKIKKDTNQDTNQYNKHYFFVYLMKCICWNILFHYRH